MNSFYKFWQSKCLLYWQYYLAYTVRFRSYYYYYYNNYYYYFIHCLYNRRRLKGLSFHICCSNIKLSSPMINNIIIGGSILMFLCVFLTAFDYGNFLSEAFEETICMVGEFLFILPIKHPCQCFFHQNQN